jgi:hypothetical protein
MGLLLRDEVGAINLLVGHRHDASIGGDRYIPVRRPDELAGHTAMTFDRVTQTHAGTTTEKPPEVSWTGEWAVLPRRGDL